MDRAGVRLGRGGGSYDRALARVRADLEIVALLYDDEVVPALPREPHDHLVTAALTPAGPDPAQTAAGVACVDDELAAPEL